MHILNSKPAIQSSLLTYSMYTKMMPDTKKKLICYLKIDDSMLAWMKIEVDGRIRETVFLKEVS